MGSLHETSKWDCLGPIFLAVAFCFNAAALIHRWNTPLGAGGHVFRETQTALTTYWLLHGGPWLHFQTPLMGPPWTIPFEFPTFQFITAGFAYVTGMGLDNAGRLVSWLFMVNCIWPLRALADRYEVDGVILCALFLGSPLFVFWGSAFLIETTSLFLCLMFLWMVEDRRWLMSLCFGILASMTKITTFIPFAGLALLSMESAAVASVSIAMLCGILWTAWTDVEKHANGLSVVLMTRQPEQMLHNFGTISQRLSAEPWRTIWGSIQDLL